MPKQKVAKILAPVVPLLLEVDDGALKLELKLAWTMKGVMLLEKALRDVGNETNILQSPQDFWTGMDATSLSFAIWAMSNQENPEYGNEAGLEVITSFLVTENLSVACLALKQCFLESLSKKRRDEIIAAEAEALKKAEFGIPTASDATSPTQAQDQS